MNLYNLLRKPRSSVRYHSGWPASQSRVSRRWTFPVDRAGGHGQGPYSTTRGSQHRERTTSSLSSKGYWTAVDSTVATLYMCAHGVIARINCSLLLSNDNGVASTVSHFPLFDIITTYPRETRDAKYFYTRSPWHCINLGQDYRD